MQELTISQIQRRTIDEATAQLTQVSKAQNSFSLREVINSRLMHPLFVPNQRALESANELSESCRQRSGINPNGIWIPLAAMTRDLTTANSGGFAVTGKVANKLQSALSTASAVMGGATILSGLTGGPISLTNFSRGIDASGSWVAEGSSGPQDEPTFSTSMLTPQTIVTEVVISRALLQNSSVDVEAEIGSELLRRTMQDIDAAAINGLGSGNQPLGLLNHGGLEVLDASTNGAAPTWADLVELEYRVGQRVALMKNPAFMVSPKLRKKLRTTARDTGYDYILSDESDKVLGHQLVCSTLLPDTLTRGSSSACSALVFGDVGEVYVGFWGPLAIDLLVDSYTYSTSGKVRLIARAEVGVAVRNIGAFAAYKDILTA